MNDNDSATNELGTNSPSKFEEYKNDEYGFSFTYPKGWNLKNQSESLNLLSIRVHSDDFIPTTESAYGGTDEGVEIVIGERSNESSPSFKDILESKAPLAEYTHDKSEVEKINGVDTFSYGIAYEGPPVFWTVFKKPNGIDYFYVTYSDAPYENKSFNIKSADYYEEYMEIVNSFKIN